MGVLGTQGLMTGESCYGTIDWAAMVYRFNWDDWEWEYNGNDDQWYCDCDGICAPMYGHYQAGSEIDDWPDAMCGAELNTTCDSVYSYELWEDSGEGNLFQNDGIENFQGTRNLQLGNHPYKIEAIYDQIWLEETVYWPVSFDCPASWFTFNHSLNNECGQCITVTQDCPYQLTCDAGWCGDCDALPGAPYGIPVGEEFGQWAVDCAFEVVGDCGSDCTEYDTNMYPFGCVGFGISNIDDLEYDQTAVDNNYNCQCGNCASQLSQLSQQLQQLQQAQQSQSSQLQK